MNGKHTLEIRKKTTKRLVVKLYFSGEGSKKMALAASEAALIANPDKFECVIYFSPNKPKQQRLSWKESLRDSVTDGGRRELNFSNLEAHAIAMREANPEKYEQIKAAEAELLEEIKNDEED